MSWKMIYLAKRNPALAPQDFAQAWREHSALGRQCKNVQDRVRQVTQCARILDDSLLPGASADFDGVNLLVLRDQQSATDIWNDAETLAIMRPDELRVFSTYVREFSLVCRETVLREAPQSSPGVCLSGFLRRRADLAPDAFRRAWLNSRPQRWLAGGPFAQALRIVHNDVHGTPPPGYEYDAICEWWFESAHEVQIAFAAAELRDSLPAPLFDLPRSVFMLTQVTHRRP